jgi:hypothetical protein
MLVGILQPIVLIVVKIIGDFFGVIYRGGEARNCDFSKKQA